jgi:hypothetical protein
MDIDAHILVKFSVESLLNTSLRLLLEIFEMFIAVTLEQNSHGMQRDSKKINSS